jgi:hypothetical protein
MIQQTGCAIYLSLHQLLGYLNRQKLAAENRNFVSIYSSPNGECIAALRPKALTPPAIQAGHYQFHWDGNAISHVLAVSECW